MVGFLIVACHTMHLNLLSFLLDQLLLLFLLNSLFFELEHVFVCKFEFPYVVVIADLSYACAQHFQRFLLLFLAFDKQLKIFQLRCLDLIASVQILLGSIDLLLVLFLLVAQISNAILYRLLLKFYVFIGTTFERQRRLGRHFRASHITDHVSTI